MSKLVNIGRENDNDPNYRYKMPALQVKFEGQGNGRRTAILNIREVCKALKCDLAYPTKFFGSELGSQSKFDKLGNKTVISGFHQPQELAQLLDKFIDLFVLCPQCHLPETSLSSQKGAVIADCAACGRSAPLQHKHKFSSFIAKNPPAARKQKPQVQVPTLPVAAEQEEDKEEWTTDTSAEAVEARRREALETLDLITPLLLDVSDVDSLIDTLEKRPFSDQNALLDTLMALFERRDDLGRRAIRILSALYDKDMLDEAHVLDWKSRATTPLRAEVAKWIAWLETAEE